MKFSRTVYSFGFKESEKAFDQIVSSDVFHDEFHRPWENNMMRVSDDFFNAWLNWVQPVVRGINSPAFKHKYPTAGSSEGVREVISSAIRAKQSIVILEGEYEGYAAYCNSAEGNLIVLARNQYEQQIKNLPDNCLFVVSNPNSLDGNVLGSAAEIIDLLNVLKPAAQVLVDLTYVGTVHHVNYQIDLTSPNIHYVCFSLSKPFGVYYHRIGGMFSKSPLLGLYGNAWFKNITSLLLGTKLMTDFSVAELPATYLPHAQELLKEAPQFKQSDVWLLGSLQTESPPAGFEEFQRIKNNYRICLTPGLWSQIRIK